MASDSQRQEVLNLLENILKNPGKYGDQFLKYIVQSSEDGMVAISSLHNMASTLNEYPIKYVRHCIPLDSKGRFRVSYCQNKIGLMSHAVNFETDQYGFVRHIGDSDEENEQDGLKEPGEISSDNEEENVEDAVSHDEENVRDAVSDSKDINQTSIYNHMLDIEHLSLKRNAVMPVIYSNGRFFIDNEPTKKFDDVKFEYDLLDVKPLGLKFSIDTNGCFNCGGNHKIRMCPEPINKARLKKNRRKFGNGNVRLGGRLYEELELQDRVSKVAPGVLSDTLRDALDMKPDDEPPYYRNMRRYGYPPGYMGKDGFQIPHGTKLTLDDVVNLKAPLIRIYDEHVEKEDEGELSDSSEELEDDGRHRRYQLVYYPGLNLCDTSRQDRYIDFDPPPPSTDDYNQSYQAQQYWDYYYNAQQPQPPILYYNYAQYDYLQYPQQANPAIPQVEFAPGTEQNATPVNPQWAYMQQSEYPLAASINPPPPQSSTAPPPLPPPPARTIITYDDLDDDQSVDMDISSDDEG